MCKTQLLLEPLNVIKHKFLEILREALLKSIPKSQQNTVPHLGYFVQVKWVSLEPTDANILWSRSRNLPERWRRKPGAKRGSLPEWSPSWSGVLCLSCQQSNCLIPLRDLSQSEFSFFSIFVWFNTYCLRAPCSIDAFRNLLFFFRVNAVNADFFPVKRR